jgi:diguanylate cyclase (GGDEF)-like protein
MAYGGGAKVCAAEWRRRHGMSNGPSPMSLFAALNQRLVRLAPASILALAAVTLVVIAAADYLTGYEVGMSLFYLGPVALAAWYAGRRPGIAFASASCLAWYIAEVATGHPYSHWVIPVWNALIRFGFFFITSLLLSTLRASLVKERQLAQTDGLTGLYSRRAFEHRLEHDLALARRHAHAMTLVYVDVDNFKAVNDTHGHGQGDQVLRMTAQVLQSSLRETDTAARLGGDEFALVLPDTDGVAAQQVIAKLTRQLDDAIAGHRLVVTFSIGVLTLLDCDVSVSEAVAAADELMYGVKRQGKAGVAFGVRGDAVHAPVAVAAARAAGH